LQQRICGWISRQRVSPRLGNAGTRLKSWSPQTT